MVNVIARVWTGRTRAEDAELYAAYVRDTGVRAHRATAGNLGSMIFQRVDGAEAEIVVVSWWDSMDSIKAFAGERPEAAVYFPEDEKILLALDPEVLHYEVPTLELDPSLVRHEP